MKKAILMGAVAMAMTLASATAASAGNSKATCFELVGGVHGTHVVGAYVLGEPTGWPPTENSAAGGAAVPGGPGGPAPGGHRSAGIAPGASFCTDSNSPGIHP